MKKISVLIIDDEPVALRRIRRYLEDDPRVEISGEAENGYQAVELIEKMKPDLVFLDIQMPKMSGFDVIRKVGPQKMPLVIFVTAYDQYTLQAFDINAVDYLLKPFKQLRFQESLNRACQRLELERKGELAGRLEALLATLNQKPPYLERILIKKDDKVILLRTENIELFDAQGNYLEIRAGNKTYLYRGSISEIIKRLDPESFIRISRSCIVNMNYVAEMQKYFRGTYLAVLHNGLKRKVSPECYKQAFKK